MKAMFYEKLKGNVVQCHLCSHHCKINDSRRGICGVRENQKGKLQSLVYGKLIANHVDPIEKKPLYHFLPGSSSYSIATVGCNLRCKNCQNWDISQIPKPQNKIVGRNMQPKDVVELAENSGCKTIAYTYTEPTVFFEYAYDIAKLAIKKKIKNVFVTNGYITKQALEKIAPYLHAANIDLKSFDDDFYLNNCGAHLDPILEAIQLYKELGIWIEITTLIIPSLNDSEEELACIAEFIKDVDISIPWHISRFHPQYQLIDCPPTPFTTLMKAMKIGLKTGLKYVYIGNIPGRGENTVCSNCGKILIERYGYNIIRNRIKKNCCPFCSVTVDGVW
jgi:pyruvate formate lyase activating enzyme